MVEYQPEPAPYQKADMRDTGQRFETVAAALTRHFGVAGTADTTVLSAKPGAYLLLIDLAADSVLDIAAFKDRRVTPGHYLYAGSANGPGGLRARLARHLRRDKKPHWHIDRLTVAAAQVAAFPITGARECALVETLLESGLYYHPLPGFGSSDCRTCMSHLLAPN